MKKLFFAICAVCVLMTACTGKSVGTNTDASQEAATEAASEVAPADEQQYIDLALPGVGGDVVKISDYVGKNKLVLVDFWASWCGPCRQEMPAVVRTYSDFHGKGLEIIGVSFDSESDSWRHAIHELKMNWPQMSDLRGWESKGAEIYDVRSIPANVLIDQKGKIVARDLRGDDLYMKVEELLK
jgi:peroxiredoxin